MSFLSLHQWTSFAFVIAICAMFFVRNRWESWLLVLGILLSLTPFFSPSPRVVVLNDDLGLPTPSLDTLLYIWPPLIGQTLFLIGLLIAGARYRACRKRTAELETLLEEIHSTRS